MTESSDPRWDLLPFDPVSFFELEQGYDRKTLKRKYNRLIKRFKPEKFPDEFQKIRAAYEVLDGELRYGQPRLLPASLATYQWTENEKPVERRGEIGESGKQGVPSKEETIGEKLTRQQPAVVYKELNEKSGKTPFDFYALAVLSDLVTKDKFMFVKWILTGLREHKLDPGLLAILCQYYKEDLDKTNLASLLLTTSKLITNDRFYIVTESLWVQLLSKCGFDEFEKTLNRCEGSLKDFRIECRLTFYIFILRRAMWSANRNWLDKAFGLVEEYHNEIPDALLNDVDILFMLKEYLDSHKEIVGDDPIRRQIHDTIVAYYSLPEKEADKAFIRKQAQLANNGNGLLDSFPTLDDECNKLFTPWSLIHYEVSERHQLEEKTNRKGLRKSVFDLCMDLDFSNQFTSANLLQYHLLSKGPYVLLFLIPFALLWTWLGSGYVLGLASILAVASVIVGHFVLQPSTLFAKSIQRKVKRLYMRNWRNRFIQVLEATKADHEDLTNALFFVIDQKQNELGLSTWLFEHVPVDIGLAFYSLTTKYTK